MSTVITPALVRRYLIATGNTMRPSERRAFDERPDDYQRLVGIIGQRIGPGPAEFSARLGMLAAAEMLRASFDANWAPGEDESVERFVRGEIRGMILAAGVDPEAWEKARGA